MDNFKIYLPWFGVGIAAVIVLFLVIKYVPLDPTKEEVVNSIEEEIISEVELPRIYILTSLLAVTRPRINS